MNPRGEPGARPTLERVRREFPTRAQAQALPRPVPKASATKAQRAARAAAAPPRRVPARRSAARRGRPRRQ
ncbi:MAG: hypothetical protein ACXWK5_11305, partial [Myxococcaceae bacterium]